MVMWQEGDIVILDIIIIIIIILSEMCWKFEFLICPKPLTISNVLSSSKMGFD